MVASEKKQICALFALSFGGFAFCPLKILNFKIFHGADGKDFMIPVCVVLTQCQGVMDGETDILPELSQSNCIASFADAV